MQSWVRVNIADILLRIRFLQWEILAPRYSITRNSGQRFAVPSGQCILVIVARFRTPKLIAAAKIELIVDLKSNGPTIIDFPSERLVETYSHLLRWLHEQFAAQARATETLG
jgi:hypothetical protein